MTLEIDLLGRFAVRRNGADVTGGEFGGQLAQRLIRLLALRRGEVVTRDALIDALWGEQPPADPEANLNVLVNRARRALGEPDAIQTAAGGYLLSRVPAVIVDAEQFEARVRAAREQAARDQPDRALATAVSALAMWRGEPLPEDAYADWAQAHRERLERTRQEALELGAATALAAGDLARAGELAAEAVSRQPLREAAHLLRIRALAAGGDPAGALAAYEVLRARFADELGIDPSREATDLQLRLLRGEPVTGPPQRPPSPAVANPARALPPLAGRERELARLAELGALRRVGIVSGPSGSGKSRLLDEAATRAGRQVLRARAVLPEREAPWSLARALLRSAVEAGADPGAVLPSRSRIALADLVPELDSDNTSIMIEAQSRRALALEGAARLIAAVPQALLLVDDLQWADASSLDLLAVLAGRAEQVTIVLAYRPEEVGPDREVAAFLTNLAATTGTVEVRLRPLAPEAVRQLVADAELAAVLAQATDGTPFAILEVIHTLERQEAVRRVGAVWHPTGPQVLELARAQARAGQRASVIARAARQPRAHRELLDLLALLGRPAPASLLAEATGAATVEVTDQLDRLAHAELVRHDQRGWTVAHDQVGEALRDHLDGTDLARLHQQLARALQGDAGGATGERAHHLAGAGDRPAAAAAYAEAAQQRLERFADREAARLAQAGLDLEPADPTRARLLAVRAETYHRTGEPAGARRDLRAALALTDGAADRSRLLSRLAGLTAGEDLERATHLVDLALTEAGDEPGARARALATAAIIDMNLERRDRAESRYAEALSLFEQVGNARGVADVLDARAMATFLDGDITAGAAAFDQVAHLFTEAGDLLRVVTPRSTRGHALVFSGMPQAGLADAEQALELARSLGNPESQAYAQWHRSEALTACGQPEDALAAASEALAIAERLGHRGWTATALRALGIARHALGDLAGAEEALLRSVSTSGNVPLFAGWAHAQLGLVRVALGRLDDAWSAIQQALRTGPPLGHYEARLARCELAVARGEPDTTALLADASERALRGGHHASLTRLRAALFRLDPSRP